MTNLLLRAFGIRFLKEKITMGTIFRRIAAITAAAAVTLTVYFAFDMPKRLTAAAEEKHTHKACGDLAHDGCTHGDIEFEPLIYPIDEQNPQWIIRGKNLYLTSDIVLPDNGRFFIQKGVTNLCLNGYSIKKNSGEIIDINNIDQTAAELNVCDCTGGGSIECTSVTENKDYYSLISVIDDSVLNIYGGTINGGEYCPGISIHETGMGESGPVNIYGGSVKTGGGIGIELYGQNASLFVYGGEVSSVDGYTIYAYGENNTVTILDGDVSSSVYNESGNTLKINGGNISCEKFSAIYNYGLLDVTDGYISCKANYAIRNYKDADLKISGGVFDAASKHILNNGTLNISGGRFIKNSGTAYLENKGILTLSGSPAFENTSIWLRSDDNIEIAGELAYADPCSVYIDSGTPRIITNGWSAYMSGKTTSDFFKSPYSFYTVAESEGEAVLRRFLIIFNANGGICPTADMSVNDNGQALPLPEATRKGYTFDGWFTAKENGEKITEDTVFSSDTELYAHWSECKHNDIYESDISQHWTVCTKCGAVGERADHLWDSGVMTKEPTDNEAGEMTYTCTVCGAEKKEDIDKLDHTHTYSDEWTFDETGHWHEASCGHGVRGEEAEHNLGSPQVTPSTCTQQGREEYVCQTCGYKKTVVLALAEHSFGGEWQKDKNNHWKICTLCGNEKSSIAEHSWNDGEITKQPTDNETGEITYTCTVCGAEKKEDIDKFGHTHTYSDDWAYDETGHWHEAVCGHDVRGEEAEHNFGSPQVTPSTCTQQGREVYVCQTCGYKKTVTLALAEHSFGGEWQKDKNSHWKLCTVCGVEKGSIAEHSWNSGEITQQPTETEAGVRTYICTVCKETKTESIPAAGQPGSPDDGNISKEVQPGENAPETVLETPLQELIDAVLTPEEKDSITDGVNIKIVLSVNDATDTVPDEDKAKVETVIDRLENFRLGQYLDVNLLKIIGETQIKITETGAPITVMFEIPEKLQGDSRNYSVIRIHNGETAVLPDLDDDKNTITIETDRFSTYALAYSEKISFVTPDNGSFNGGDPAPSESEAIPPVSSDISADNEITSPPSDQTLSTEESSVSSNVSTPPSNNAGSDPNAGIPVADNSNPPTGTAVSLIPLAAAVTVLAFAVMRKKK